jgi:CTP-dependent riboflavin kinase
MADGRKVTGVVFSDMAQGASFMALEWVRRVLREKLGFSPYAGTLNLRLESTRELSEWRNILESIEGIDIPSPDPSFCRSRCFMARLGNFSEGLDERLRVAVLVPQVPGYPADKIEIVASCHIKESLHVRDGDRLTLEFTGQ